MTQEKLIDAVTELDSDILDRYFLMKQALAEKKKPRKRTWVKWTSLAACLCLVITASIIAIPTISNMLGFNHGLSEDEMFERTNTYFDSYEELAAIIGNDTLLENIDFANLNDYELRLVHELDNVNDYHTVSFVNIMPEAEFGVGIHFPPYEKKTPNYIWDSQISHTVIINGITVKYQKHSPENYKYDISAEFEYNGCCYQIRSTGNTDESVFWDNLNALLGVSEAD